MADDEAPLLGGNLTMQIIQQNRSGKTVLPSQAKEPLITSDHNLFKNLLDRHISLEALKVFGIKPDGRGWSYPVPYGGESRRWKSFDSQATMKYAWKPKKPSEVCFYFGPGLFEAVKAAGNVLWYVSGEPDVWALWTAGITHVISGFTETRIPKKLLNLLRSMGVLTVYTAPDLDNTGDRFAQKLTKALEGSEIELNVQKLPSELGRGGDLGKAWQTYTGNLSFEHWLLSLEPTFLQSKAVSLRNKFIPTSGGEIPEGYKQAIIHNLEFDGFGSTGFSQKNIHCPFHDDQHPSGSLHHIKGLYCHSEDSWFRWTDIGEKLGMGTISQWRSMNQSEHPSCLSTESREALIRVNLTILARLLDTLYLSGFQPGVTFTVKEAANACKPHILEKRSIYRAISRCKEHPTFCQILAPNSSLQQLKSKNIVKKSRPSVIYRLPSPRQIVEISGAFTGIEQHYDPMPIEALTSNKLYRAEVYAAFPRRHPGQYPRKSLAKRVGVSNQTARKYDKFSNLNVSPRYKHQQLDDEKKINFPERREEMPGNCWIENEDGKKYQPTNAGFIRAQESSDKLFLVTQEANYYASGDRQI